MCERVEPVIGDAFGIALSRCWAGGVRPGVAFEVIERDDGFIGVGDVARYFDGPNTWKRPERWAYEQADGRILDVGCGAGRHAVPLRQAGYEVIGLDTSPAAVQVTRQRGADAIIGSVEDVPARVAPIDTVLMLGNNLGLLGGPTQATRVLAGLAAVTTPGSQLLGTGLDPYRTTTPEHQEYHRRNQRRGRLAGQIRMRVRHGTLATPWFDYLLVTVDELVVLLDGTPWRLHGVEQDDADYAVRLVRQ